MAMLAVGVGGCRPEDPSGGVQRDPEQELIGPVASMAGPSKPVAPVQLAFEVRDVARGEPIPAKITLFGAAGTPDPDLAYGDVPREVKGGIAAHNYVMTLSGNGSFEVPRGRYDIYASRGPEWDLWVARGVVIGAEGASIRPALAQVVDTRGWISADFHVHSEPSYDSQVPLGARVHQFVADGVDMLVAADHDVVTDYGPVVAKLDATDVLATATGEEITVDGMGHFGAFPLTPQRGATGNGAVLTKGRSAGAIFRDVRARGPGALISVHHPRFNWGMGFFQIGELVAEEDRAGASFSFDFDALEVLNGLELENHESVEAVLADWFALLRHGHMVAATGNSDTHSLDRNIGGYPRNYIRVTRDTPAAARPAEVARAVRGLHATFTTAPFVRLSVGGASLGDLAQAPGGRIHGEISVQAAPWVSVSRVVLYLDGVEVRRFRVSPSGDVERFQASFDLSTERDAFLVARVEGDEPLAPVVGGATRFKVWPFALTNPVLIDANGDRRFTPPAKAAGRRATL
ncbi:CehA/McbA family metallohydrolase [Chondromyces apiculatus]|uniref:CehA/McbA family metallohydrolase n=1 Tax=Chondromyces apiculatus TaxID=51 RepID=UPI001E39B8E0|nr:CehA/McbA family metallohydrolase [Chondromyces apiculatus]